MLTKFLALAHRIKSQHLNVNDSERQFAKRMRAAIKTIFDILKNVSLLAALKFTAVKGNSRLVTDIYNIGLLLQSVYVQTYLFGLYLYVFGRRPGKFRIMMNAVVYGLMVGSVYVIANHYIGRIASKLASIQAIH